MLSSRSWRTMAVISPCASSTSLGSGRSKSSDPRSYRLRRMSFASSSIARSEGTRGAKRERASASPPTIAWACWYESRAALRMTPSWNAVFSHPPGGVEVDDHRLREAVPALHEAADVARECVREHGHDPVGEVDRRAAQVGLLVEHPALAHVVGHVRDVDREAVAPVLPALDPDRVVVVARRLGVDRDREPAPEVGPPGHLVRPHRARHALRLLLDLRREGVGQGVLGDDDLEVDAGVGEVAQDLGDPPHGVARGGGRPGHVRRDHLARDGAAFLPDRDEQLVQHAAIEGHDVPAEATRPPRSGPRCAGWRARGRG